MDRSNVFKKLAVGLTSLTLFSAEIPTAQASLTTFQQEQQMNKEHEERINDIVQMVNNGIELTNKINQVLRHTDKLRVYLDSNSNLSDTEEYRQKQESLPELFIEFSEKLSELRRFISAIKDPKNKESVSTLSKGDKNFKKFVEDSFKVIDAEYKRFLRVEEMFSKEIYGNFTVPVNPEDYTLEGYLRT